MATKECSVCHGLGTNENNAQERHIQLCEWCNGTGVEYDGVPDPKHMEPDPEPSK